MTPDERLMEALRFYADEWNWQPDGAVVVGDDRTSGWMQARLSKVEDDGGTMARCVLRELDQ